MVRANEVGTPKRGLEMQIPLNKDSMCSNTIETLDTMELLILTHSYEIGINVSGALSPSIPQVNRGVGI